MIDQYYSIPDRNITIGGSTAGAVVFVIAVSFYVYIKR